MKKFGLLLKRKIVNMWPWITASDKNRLLTILFLALVIRIVFVSVLNPDGYYFSDTRHYDGAAKHLLAGEGFGDSYNRAPLYPLMIAGIYYMFGTSFLMVRLVEALLGVLICYLVYGIVREKYSATVAGLACFLSAVFPHFILLTGLLYPTQTFMFFLALALYFVLKINRKRHFLYMSLSAFFSALASLTVPSMFFILPFWILWIFVFNKKQMGEKLADVAVFIFVFSLFLSPWTLRNYQKYGRLTLVQPLPHTVLPNLSDLSEQKKEIQNGFKKTDAYRREHPTGTNEDSVINLVLHYVKNPSSTLKHLGSEMRHFWALYPDRLDTKNYEYRKTIHADDNRMVMGKDVMWRYVKIISILILAPLFLLAIIGLFYSDLFSPFTSLMLLTILGLSTGYSMIYSEVRYRIPVEPYIIILAAVGIYNLWRSPFLLKLQKTQAPF